LFTRLASFLTTPTVGCYTFVTSRVSGPGTVTATWQSISSSLPPLKELTLYADVVLNIRNLSSTALCISPLRNLWMHMPINAGLIYPVFKPYREVRNKRSTSDRPQRGESITSAVCSVLH